MSGRNSPGENEGKAAAVTSEAEVEKLSELEKPIDVKASETLEPDEPDEPAELGEQHDQGE